jgi:hypothetical protein
METPFIFGKPAAGDYHKTSGNYFFHKDFFKQWIPEISFSPDHFQKKIKLFFIRWLFSIMMQRDEKNSYIFHSLKISLYISGITLILILLINAAYASVPASS